MNSRDYTTRQRKGLFAATLAQMMVATSSLALAPLASLIQADFGLTRAELGVMLAAGATGSVIIAMPSGWLSDILGVRRVVFTGLVWGGLVFATVSLTGSAPLALLLVLCSGLGTGVISPATTKGILYWFPARFRGTAMGIKQTGYALGGAATAAILPTLALSLGGWRQAVLAVGVVATCMAVVYLLLYSEHPQQTYAGVGQPSGLAMIRLVSTDPRILSLAALAFCYGYNQSTLMGYLSLYLQETLSMSIVVAGGFLMLAQVSGAAGRLGWGIISDRFFGSRRAPVLAFVTALCGVTSLIFGTLAPVVPSLALGALVVLFGLTAVGWSGLYHVFAGETAGREKAGTAVGLCLMVCSVGSVLGPPIFGFIVDATHSYTVAWASQALAAFGGVTLILRMRREVGLSPTAQAAE
ncbi:MAG: MFS transporter [Dehalococcoidales bacterium]|nr:MFS transporter [Dehalococcoidales bacterium]